MNLQEAFGLVNEAAPAVILQGMIKQKDATFKRFKNEGLRITVLSNKALGPGSTATIEVIAKGSTEDAFNDLKTRLSNPNYKFNPKEFTGPAKSGLLLSPAV